MSARPQNHPHLRARRLRRLSFERLESRRVLSITVDTLLDELDGSITDGDISLRDAIAAAPAGETIDFSVSGAINLSMGELELTRPLTIDGPGAEMLAVDAQQNSRIFNITVSSGEFSIADITLTGGKTTGDNASVDDNTYNGGAVRSLTTGSLTIQNSDVCGNSTTGSNTYGGAIFAEGEVAVISSTISNNSAVRTGGGIAATGLLTITDSSISYNSALLGGGISSDDPTTVTTSSVQGNVAAVGGGILALDELTVSGSTISGSYGSVDGAGIYAVGPLTVTGSTISDNVTGVQGSGGGIHFLPGGSSSGFSSRPEHEFAHATITDSTISGNTAGHNGGGGLMSWGPTTVIGSMISGNTAIQNGNYRGSGGGIRAVRFAPTISDSFVWENSAAGHGGGIAAFESTIFGSTISGNTAGLNGGGIDGGGTIFDSTISNNMASGNGGGFTGATISIIGSTISGNTSFGAGGGLVARSLQITDSTITDNEAWHAGGGIWADTLAIDNSIVAGNFDDGTGTDIWHDMGTLSVSHSLIGENTGTGLSATGSTPDPVTGNLVGSGFSPIDPLLEPLGDHGGTTETHALLPGSLAVDAGDPQAIPSWGDFPFHDQRGFPFQRQVGSRMDMGAVEFGAVSADFNEDLVVDYLDFAIWRQGNGISSGATHSDGDANGDGAVDELDLAIWQSQFGSVAGYIEPIVVDTLNDGFDGDITAGNFSLREAIAVADRLRGEQTITFDAILFSTLQTLLLTSGDFTVLDSLAIAGPGPDLLTIEAQQSSRVFTSSAPDLSLSGLTLTGGRPATDEDGGAIQGKNVTLTQTTVSGNRVSGEYANGGGIAASHVTLAQSTVSNNTTNAPGLFASGGNGGGIHARTVAVSQSTVSDNVALGDGQGGGIAATAVKLYESTVSGNTTRSGSGGSGGGISAHAVTLNQSTISGNRVLGDGSGGGIDANWVTLYNSTVSDNLVANGAGGGIDPGYGGQPSDTLIVGSIIAANTAGGGSADLRPSNGTLTVKYSLIGDATGLSITGPGNILNQNPMLAPLADNGGPTQTHALLPGSPALDAGDLDFVAPPYFDQRGAPFVRVYNDRIDIGSFESQPVMPDGDFNDDGLYDCLDIDALVAEIAAGNHVGSFDMTGDGFVDLADRDAWLAGAGAINLGPGKLYLLGDANLDGFVDGLDFVEWNENKFTFLAAWCGGDFTADGIVDGLDYIEWNTNKFQSSDVVSEIVSPRLSSDPHEITSPNQVYNDTDVDRLSVTPRLAPLAAKMVDSVFATSRRSEDHKNMRQRADSFANLGALAINPYLF